MPLEVRVLQLELAQAEAATLQAELTWCRREHDLSTGANSELLALAERHRDLEADYEAATTALEVFLMLWDGGVRVVCRSTRRPRGRFGVS